MTSLVLSCAALSAGAFGVGCAEGGNVEPTSSSSGSSGMGGSGNGGEGPGGSGGKGGDGGSTGNGGTGGGSGGSGGTSGAAGMGGTGGGSVTRLELCVLNAGGPADPCATPENLSFDTVPAGTQRMRSFRIDNESTADAIFDSVSIQDPDYSVETVRYVEDPPNDPSQWLRVPVNLPSTRPPGGSLYFEVTYTSAGKAEMLAPAEAVVTAAVDGMAVPDIVVPIVGESLGCATGTAACDNTLGNGCDTNTNTTVAHCGACNNMCNLANTSSSCVAGTCQVATCSTGFSNCNGMSADGCEIDTTTNMMHCGGCNTVCDLPNASEVCGAGLCLITACMAPFENCDAQNPNGCETNPQTDIAHCGGCNMPCSLANATEACVAGSCTIATCEGTFGNCDNNTANGCEVDTNTSISHCGTCNNACNFANAADICMGGTCSMGACDTGYTNCDTMTANGCETNTAGDPLNCGACNNNCSTLMVNANVSCMAGTCQLGTCLSGYFNADGNAQNGCECTFVGPDLPDDTFADTNCDGIDGDVSAAIFVATTGSDANPGTRQQPMFSLAGALSRAQQNSKTQIYVSAGTYDARVTLVNGISIYGGYNAQNNWTRSVTNYVTIQSSATTGGRVTAIEGSNLTSPMTLDRLTIRTLDAPATTGLSNYAMYCNNCPGVRLRNNNIIAAVAGNGTTGTNGVVGGGGVAGNPGSPGACDSGGVRTGGSGGGSSCGRSGGGAGNGGAAGANPGGNGSPGVGGTAGGAGGSGGNPGQPGAPGSNGANGANGNNGPGGNGGSTTTSYWVGNGGGAGTAAGHGNGGGGGGGGGGQGGGVVIPGGGNGGGGGGGGGCAGSAGTGGTAGGGSFGLFIVNSNGMQLINNSITSGKGGNGGNGGTGAFGGAGAIGGSGATTCTGEVGAGGNGGRGGDGGRGGHGGGGSGGPSIAVYRVNSSSVATAGNILVAGMGGLGGTSMGNAGFSGTSAPVTP